MFAPDTANRLYGYAQEVIAVGAILGGALAGVFSKKLKFKASPLILIGCALSVLIGGIDLQTLKAPMAIYVVVAIGGGLLAALSTLFQIQIMTCVQIVTPQGLIGKVIACVIGVCMCALPLGQLLYGIVFEKIENSTYLPCCPMKSDYTMGHQSYRPVGTFIRLC